MINTVKISDMSSLFSMISEQDFRSDLGRYRNLFVYRVQPNSEFKLVTSLMRNC